jgi:hypothetical protein
MIPGNNKKIAARLSFSSAGGGGVEHPYDEEEEEEGGGYRGARSEHAPPEKFQRIKDDDDDFEFDTPGQQQPPQGQRQQRQPDGSQNVLTSPQEVAQTLFDRVQRQQQQQQNSGGPPSGDAITPVPSKPIRSLGKASRIPVPSRSRSAHPHSTCGRQRESASRVTPAAAGAGGGGAGAGGGGESPMSPRTAAGRGAGRQGGGKAARGVLARSAPDGGAEAAPRRTTELKGDQLPARQQEEEETARRQLQECWDAGQATVFSILSVFSQAYQLVSQYQCTECIRHLQRLPRRHYSSGWVQHVLGKAYFELNDYKVSGWYTM